MLEYLVLLLVFVTPTASFVWFAVSLIRMLIAPKGSEARAKRRKLLVISAITYGVFVAIFVAIAVWFLIGLMYM